MSTFFFHLAGSGARDTDGQEFPNEEAAREEAAAIARDIAKNRRVSAGERIVVTDADGKTRGAVVAVQLATAAAIRRQSRDSPAGVGSRNWNFRYAT